jgi:DNA-binding NtrC family response regulator
VSSHPAFGGTIVEVSMQVIANDRDYSSMRCSVEKKPLPRVVDLTGTSIVTDKNRRTILVHSADKDLTKSLSILLQEDYDVLTTETPEEFSDQRDNKNISLIVVDLEKSIPELLREFEMRRNNHCDAPIIVLYAFRQSKMGWESSIRNLVNQLLYKPVPIDQILNAISIEEHLRLRVH